MKTQTEREYEIFDGGVYDTIVATDIEDAKRKARQWVLDSIDAYRRDGFETVEVIIYGFSHGEYNHTIYVTVEENNV